jgi:hypothetical protein
MKYCTSTSPCRVLCLISSLHRYAHLTSTAAPLILHADSWVGSLGVLTLRLGHAAGRVLPLCRMAAGARLVRTA